MTDSLSPEGRLPQPFSGRQRTLLEALRERDPRLAVMYHGAIWVLQQPSHPDPYPHAAHAMRELMEKLPIYLDVPVPTKDASLTVKVNELAASFERTQSNSACHSDKGWDGRIDRPLGKLLRMLEDFIRWHRSTMPKRKERTASVLRGLDPMGAALPGPIEELRVSEWHVLVQYFQAVSHHRNDVKAEGFDAYMRQAEIFILDRLRPRTFEDHARLERLIGEAEGDAKA